MVKNNLGNLVNLAVIVVQTIVCHALLAMTVEL